MRIQLVRRSNKKRMLYSVLGLIISALLTYYFDRKKQAFEPFKMYLSNNIFRKRNDSELI